jgi:hypothetical protein
MGEGGQVPPSTSLMMRGNILKETNESEVFKNFHLSIIFKLVVRNIESICSS